VAEENRDWGYDRIAGAVANLGYGGAVVYLRGAVKRLIDVIVSVRELAAATKWCNIPGGSEAANARSRRRYPAP
jgi:hypothetical protein